MTTIYRLTYALRDQLAHVEIGGRSIPVRVNPMEQAMLTRIINQAVAQQKNGE